MADPLVSDASLAVLGALPDWNLPSDLYPDDYCQINASSEADPVEAAATNLQDADPTTWWRSTSGYRRDCIIQGLPIKPRKIGAFGLAGSSLSAEAWIRFRARWDGDDFAPRTRLAPNAIITQTGLSNGLSDITDDPESPGGTHMVVTGAGAVLHVSFATPTTWEQVLSGVHSFRLLIQNTSATTSSTLTACALYESGVLKKDLIADRDGTTTPIQLAESSNTIHEVIFSAADLVDTTGADLELRIVFAGTVSGGEIRLRALDLHYESAAPGSDYYDTGFLRAWTADLLTLAGGRTFADVSPRATWRQQRTFAHAVAVDGVYANLDLVQAAPWEIQIHDPWEAFVEASMAPVGQARYVRLREQLTFGAQGRQVILESASGSQSIVARRGRGQALAPFVGTRAEIDAIYQQFAGGESGWPFLWIPQPAGETYFHGRPLVVTTGSGQLPEMSLYSRRAEADGGGLWSLSVPVEEFW